MPDTETENATEAEFAMPQAPQEVAIAQPIQTPSAAPQSSTILLIIERAARDPSVDIDKMERLILMQERIGARQAQIDYDNAMSDAQEAMKAIRADAENPQTKSRYATYAALDHAVRPIYSRHGFALSFNTGDSPKADELRVLCSVSHRGGHRQEYKLDMPADGKGARGGDVMTRTHATGAAASYGQRYLLKLIFNLAVGDIDDDGNGASYDEDDDVRRLANLDNVDPATGKLRSTYDTGKIQKAKDFADAAIQLFNLSPNAEAAKDWRRDNRLVPTGKKKSPLQWLEDNAPGQFLRVKTAFENVTGEEF